jgi:hypothetical protein
VSEVGACKVESWASAASNHDFIAAVSPTCVVDFGRPVEASTQITRARTADEWTSGATPKLKTNIVPTAIGEWGFALSGQAGYDLKTATNSALAVTVPATLRLSNVARINLNAGWLWDRAAEQHYASYGAGFDLRTPDNVWTWTAEVFGVAGRETDTRSVTQPRFQTGIRWRPVDEFNIDLIYGRNIAGEGANWITLATVIRFKAGQ